MKRHISGQLDKEFTLRTEKEKKEREKELSIMRITSLEN